MTFRSKNKSGFLILVTLVLGACGTSQNIAAHQSSDQNQSGLQQKIDLITPISNQPKASIHALENECRDSVNEFNQHIQKAEETFGGLENMSDQDAKVLDAMADMVIEICNLESDSK